MSKVYDALPSDGERRQGGGGALEGVRVARDRDRRLVEVAGQHRAALVGGVRRDELDRAAEARQGDRHVGRAPPGVLHRRCRRPAARCRRATPPPPARPSWALPCRIPRPVCTLSVMTTDLGHHLHRRLEVRSPALARSVRRSDVARRAAWSSAGWSLGWSTCDIARALADHWPRSPARSQWFYVMLPCLPLALLVAILAIWGLDPRRPLGRRGLRPARRGQRLGRPVRLPEALLRARPRDPDQPGGLRLDDHPADPHPAGAGLGPGPTYRTHLGARGRGGTRAGLGPAHACSCHSTQWQRSGRAPPRQLVAAPPGVRRPGDRRRRASAG